MALTQSTHAPRHSSALVCSFQSVAGIELHLYCRFFGRTTNAPSKAAFYKQRQKLRHDALRNLLIAFNSKLKKIYTITSISLLPAMADAADNNNAKIVYFCDMEYAFYNNFAHVIENGQYFLIRCNDRRTEGILGFSPDNVKEPDVHVDRILTGTQSKKKHSRPELEKNYRFICPRVAMDYLISDKSEYDISLRVVRIKPAEGSFENIITNLPDLEFDIDDFKDLCHLRWGIENSFRDIKFPLCLKAFVALSSF